uniref:NADH-ubiquinone oxidoreductase chain 4L n=1 Tax=Aulacochilus grouvellei TaxID=2800504 RepID=A0A7T6YA22_9CUCU|nr:NADH dehydrogenase subunit 4L [Aulacochilus grouvellei]QQK56321.1 NADH dehydrogenase subunit 4L [Aulacochilus grouvellei]
MLNYFLSFMLSGVFICGLASFSFKHKHMLSMLLSLEFTVLCVYLNIFMYLMMNNTEMFFLMIYLTMSVCEGAMGLTILVLMIRTYGNDYIMTFTSLW